MARILHQPVSVYQHHFGFVEAPFSIAPDPRYLYLSQRHQEALAHLLYGINGNGGFVLLTGDVGAGKTTVCRCLLEQIPPSCDVAYIFNPKLTVEELLSTICNEFNIAYSSGTPSIKVYVDCINAYLLEAHANGRQTVLIIDEAQNLSVDVLEQMRLLTNLETSQRKLLQIILIGQPELAAMLERPELRQVSQRIVARYRLGPLSKKEVAAYVAHRLEIAGATRQLFSPRLTGELYRLTHGIPRVINVLCDRALLGTYVQGKERVDAATLAQAAQEVFHRAGTRRNVLRALIATLILAAGMAAAFTFHRQAFNAAGVSSEQATVRAPASADAAPAVRQTGGSVVAAAATASPVFPNSLEWRASDGPATSRALAFAGLLKEWGQSLDAGADPCKQAEGAGLRCHSARGGLDELRALNRPAVLRMRNGRGEEFWATLTALADDNASFALGDQSATVSLDAVAAQWSGHYTLLWRMPPQVRDPIHAGQLGPAVQWLTGQLALARGQAAPVSDDRVFDEELEREVRKFQLVHGLVPDGSVGPQTLMHLASWGDPAAPKLSSRQANK